MPDWLTDVLKNQAGVTILFAVFLVGLWKVISPLANAVLDLLKTMREESPKQTASLEIIKTKLIDQDRKFDDDVRALGQQTAMLQRLVETNQQQTINLAEHRKDLVEKFDNQTAALGQQTALLRNMDQQALVSSGQLVKIADSVEGVKDIAKAQVEHRRFAQEAVKGINKQLDEQRAKLTDHDLSIKEMLDEALRRKKTEGKK